MNPVNNNCEPGGEPAFSHAMHLTQLAKEIQHSVLVGLPTALVVNGPVAYICMAPSASSEGITIRIELTKPASPDSDQLYWSQDFQHWAHKQHEPKKPKAARKEGSKPKAKKEVREII